MPYRKLFIDTHLSTTETADVISQALVRLDAPAEPVFGVRHQFVGHVGSDDFSITRKGSGALYRKAYDDFEPIVNGKFISTHLGTCIDVSMTYDWGKISWYIFILIGTVIFWIYHESLTFITLMKISGLFIFSYSLALCDFWWRANKAEEFLSNLFSHNQPLIPALPKTPFGMPGITPTRGVMHKLTPNIPHHNNANYAQITPGSKIGRLLFKLLTVGVVIALVVWIYSMITNARNVQPVQEIEADALSKEVEINLMPDTYELCYEYQLDKQGNLYSKDLPQLYFELVSSEAGQTVEMFTAPPNIYKDTSSRPKYSYKGRKGIALYEFTITRAGQYKLTTFYASNSKKEGFLDIIPFSNSKVTLNHHMILAIIHYRQWSYDACVFAGVLLIIIIGFYIGLTNKKETILKKIATTREFRGERKSGGTY